MPARGTPTKLDGVGVCGTAVPVGGGVPKISILGLQIISE